MRGAAKAVIIVILSAIVSHIAFIYTYPYIIALSRYLETRNEVKVNEAYHQAPIDASFRKIVRPSPDILYSACVYDISELDLLIEAKVPNFTYWSAAFYSMGTDNYYTINNRAVHENITIILTTSKEKCSSLKNARGVICVVSPSARGIVIFRIFIPNSSLLPELIEYQKTIKCTQIKK